MNSKFAILTLATLISSSALAEGISIKPKVVHSQVKTDAESFSVGGFTQGIQSDSNDTSNGLGFGADIEFHLDERARFGSEITITNYEEDGAEAQDMALGGFFAYDFISQNNMVVYGKGGISLHQFALEDFNSASLLNGDLGAGVAFALTPTTDLGGEYRYSTTLGKGDMSTEDSSAIKYNDVSIERNDLSLFVTFKF